MRRLLGSLLTPDRGRWQPMLIGLACFAAAAGAAVLTKETAPVSLAFTVLAFAAWVTGACAAVGYVRWLFVQAMRDQEGR